MVTDRDAGYYKKYAAELRYRLKRIDPNNDLLRIKFPDALTVVECIEEEMLQLRHRGIREELFQNKDGVKNVMDVKLKTERTFSLTIDGLSDRCLGALINHLRKITVKDIDEDNRLTEVIDFREKLDEAFYKEIVGGKSSI